MSDPPNHHRQAELEALQTRVEAAMIAAQAAGVDDVARVRLTASIAEEEVKEGVPDGVLAGREGNSSDALRLAVATTTAPRTLVTVAATVAALEGAVETVTSLKKRRQVHTYYLLHWY